MAESPGAPETLTSYSDPLYDRLEGVVRQMGRKWWLIAILILIIAGAAVVMQQRAQQAPEAASALAVQQATDEGIDALAAVADDPEVLPEFRARAALEAANLALQAGEADRAASLLATAETQAAATPLQDLQLTITASQAAVLEEQGAYEDAAARYTQVVDRTAASLPGLNLLATLGAARSTMLQAQNTEDPAQAAELRALAHEQFTFASERSVEGAEQLIQYARFQRYDLERRHPELAGGEAAASPESATGTPAETEAPAEEPAPGAPAEEATPAE